LTRQAIKVFNDNKLFPNLFIFSGVASITKLHPLIELCETLLSRDFSEQDARENCKIRAYSYAGLQAKGNYILISKDAVVIGKNPIRTSSMFTDDSEFACQIRINEEKLDSAFAFVLYFEIWTEIGWTKVVSVTGNDHIHLNHSNIYWRGYWQDCLDHFLRDDLEVLGEEGDPIAVYIRSLSENAFDQNFNRWIKGSGLPLVGKERDFNPGSNWLAYGVAGEFALVNEPRQLTHGLLYSRHSPLLAEGSTTVYPVKSDTTTTIDSESDKDGYLAQISAWWWGENRDFSPFYLSYSTIRIKEDRHKEKQESVRSLVNPDSRECR
jgi:hypothetical protein